MKKFISFFAATVFIMGTLTACGSEGKTTDVTDEQVLKQTVEQATEQVKIVTTTFPEYDWVRNILGGNPAGVEVTMLLDNGVDLHSYQPTTEDMIKISNCDMFVYVGGESDEWVEDALAQAENENMMVVDLMDVLGNEVKEEEIVEGMEHEHDEHHDEEITKEDIKDRTLAEFSGEWQSMHPLLLEGRLEQFCEYKAENDEDASTTKETMYEKYKNVWACDAKEIKIEDNAITFTYSDGTTASAEYTYAGYSIKYAEDGSIGNVRYQFETESADAPKYVQFNDHGHEPAEVEHFHIYFGDESFEALLSASTNPYFMRSGLTDEEILEGLTGHNHSHEHESDEHVWLSLHNAEVICRDINEKLGALDPANAEIYTENTESYCEKLNKLNSEYEAAVEDASVKTLLFGDRFPFRYLVDDYNLDYYAAFAGCSAETEASFETIIFLAKKVDELGLHAVMTIEGTEHKIAETIVQSTTSKDQQILTMDSMQATTSSDVENGKTYLSVMESNLEVLKEALK